MSVKLVHNIFYNIQKTPEVPGVPKYFSEVVEAPEYLPKLQNNFQGLLE